MTSLPREMAASLSKLKNKEGKPAASYDRFNKMRDWLDQRLPHSVEFYHFPVPPKILIFYTTESENEEQKDWETEKNCVEAYFAERKFPCFVEKDPTSEKIFSAISTAAADASSSGLLVFVLSHGVKGMIAAAGSPGYITIQDVITHMCSAGSVVGKPKVSHIKDST